MRRLLSSVILLVLLFAVSCSTTVSIPYIQPSVIDMGYRNLAVASAVPYRGFVPYTGWIPGRDIYASRFHIRTGYSYSVVSGIAEYATEELYSTLLNSGFFNLLSPSRTDRMRSLTEVAMVMISQRSSGRLDTMPCLSRV